MIQLTPIVSKLYTTAIISFLCLNILAQKVDTGASFPGGITAWRKYLERNLHYPEAAQKNNTQGVVRVEMMVDKDGKIITAKALNDPGDGLADEAVRVVKNGPDWVPAMQNGIPVTYTFVQKVTFMMGTGAGTSLQVIPYRYNQSIVVKTPRLYNGKAVEYIIPTYDLNGADVILADRKSYFVNPEEAMQQFGLVITNTGFVVPEDATVLYFDNNGISSDNYRGLKFIGGKRQLGISAFFRKGAKPIDADRQPVFLLNGKEVNAADVQQLVPYQVRGSNLLKFQDEPAIAKLGSKGKNGLLILSTKLAYPDNYLYLLNGKESANEEIAKLPPGSYKKMKISTGNRTLEEYGAKAKYGVVAVDTRTEEDQKQYDTLFAKTENPPTFPGGDEAWKKYIAANLRYPEAALKNKTEGTVRVGVTISPDGTIKEVAAYNTPADGLAQEAIRLIKEGPQWIPAKHKGINVTYRLMVPITFKIDRTNYF